MILRVFPGMHAQNLLVNVISIYGLQVRVIINSSNVCACVRVGEHECERVRVWVSECDF